MSSPSKESEEPSSSSSAVANGEADEGGSGGDREGPRPAKRPASTAVIEISDTDSDDSDICAVSSYQASADEVKRIRGGECPSDDPAALFSYWINAREIWTVLF